MAMSSNAPNHTNRWLWGGVAVAAIVVLGALGYWLDWFGAGTTTEVSPAVEQTAPVTE